MRPPNCGDITLAAITDLTAADIRRRSVLGGLINGYERAAWQGAGALGALRRLNPDSSLRSSTSSDRNWWSIHARRALGIGAVVAVLRGPR